MEWGAKVLIEMDKNVFFKALHCHDKALSPIFVNPHCETYNLSKYYCQSYSSTSVVHFENLFEVYTVA